MLLNDLAKNPAFGSVEAVERAIRDGTFARKLGRVSAMGECDGMEPLDEDTPGAARSSTDDKSTTVPAHFAID